MKLGIKNLYKGFIDDGKLVANAFRRLATPGKIAKLAKRSRWGAAETSRLNKGHWSKAGNADGSINNDLTGSLAELCRRCSFEVANNPMVEGVIDTWATDLVGSGPTFQCNSSSKKYNEGLEAIWKEWWKHPDITGRLSGPELLRMSVRQLPGRGEYIIQIVADKSAKTPIKTRVYPIHTRRLKSPLDCISDTNVVMGIKIDEYGRPAIYYFERETDASGGFVTVGECDPVPAAEIIHHFKRTEPDQVRGFPLLSSALDAIGEIRDYDDQVMDAARNCADRASYFFTDHPEITPFPLDEPESIEIERRMMQSLPPGWKPFEATASQPAANYVEFHHERLREIGRPFNMPLMMIILDSQKHSYSSSRSDRQGYQRGLTVEEAAINNSTLTPFADAIAAEAELANLLPPRPPDVSYEWIWPPMPHVDPSKEAKAEHMRLDDKTTSRSRVCAGLGIDLETLIRELAREKKLFKKHGLTDKEVDKGVDKKRPKGEGNAKT